MYRYIRSFLMAGLLIVSGCMEPGPLDEEAPGDTLRKYVLSIQSEPFRRAFADVRTFPHEIDRVDVMEGSSPETAMVNRAVIVYDGTSYVSEDARMEGTLPPCRVCRFVGGTSAPDLDAIAAIVLDEDPPFLNERGISAFTFRRGRDTLIDGLSLETIHASAIDGEHRAGRYRNVTMYVLPDTRALIGIEASIERSTMFVSEIGTREAYLTQGPTGFTPSKVSIVNDVSVLLGDRRVIHTELRYRPSSESTGRSPS
jgi:hypothetical protein